MLNKIAIIVLLGIAYLFFKGTDGMKILRQQETATAELDSINQVLQVISKKVYISVPVTKSFDYDTPFKFYFLRIGTFHNTNNLVCTFKYCFNFGFDLTKDMKQYYNQGYIQTDVLRNNIKIINSTVTREVKEEMGAFQLRALDSLENKAYITALDSISNWFEFDVQMKEGQPELIYKTKLK